MPKTDHEQATPRGGDPCFRLLKSASVDAMGGNPAMPVLSPSPDSGPMPERAPDRWTRDPGVCVRCGARGRVFATQDPDQNPCGLDRQGGAEPRTLTQHELLQLESGRQAQACQTNPRRMRD